MNDRANTFGVSEQYLFYRQQVLNYSYHDMNLHLENDDQVYIAVFDIPSESNIVGFQVQTLALVFGLNTHIYQGSGNAITNLEKNSAVMRAMQSLFISCPQVLSSMKLTTDTSFYESKHTRAYLKSRKGTYFMELDGNTREEEFLLMLMRNVMGEIAKNI